MMKNMKQLEQRLRKSDYRQAKLYLLCNFISLLLITAYSAMMFSPTVQNILPTGGDSRKQMYAIFVLALFGCVAFTIYASTLFFRKKSRQLGILMALGASRERLAPGLFREVLILSSFSSLAGIVAGVPFFMLLWNGFRVFAFQSAEMSLRLDFRFLFVSAAFFVLVVGCACILSLLYLRRTDIIDVVQEEHKNEPVRELGRWCGPVGFVLLFAGAVMGYFSGRVYMQLFSKYPPSWLNITYAPFFVGLYMVMLHTVVHGWTRHKKHPYKNIISRSMMKFQGRQTVITLLVTTVLIAGGCFGIFYIPTLSTGFTTGLNAQSFDYAWHAPEDVNVPNQAETEALAGEYGVAIRDWREAPMVLLAYDGQLYVEEEDTSFHYEYRERLSTGYFLSETGYRNMTGQDVEIPAGSYCTVTTADGVNTWEPSANCTVFTNMETGETLSVQFQERLFFQLMAGNTPYMILDDGDYKTISAGLTSGWKENLTYFNVDVEDSYAFANDLFRTYLAAFPKKYNSSTYADPVRQIESVAEGDPYFAGYEDELHVDFSRPDSSDLRMNWTYMPKFKALDLNDNMRTYAVFYMVFIFVAVICLTAALVIGYTRCQTIALNNRYIFEDLHKLGASPAFLTEEIHRQCTAVFRIPAIIGMGVMYFLYGMIFYANDGIFSRNELISFALCFGIIILIGGFIYGIYLHTVRQLCRQLGIRH